MSYGSLTVALITALISGCGISGTKRVATSQTPEVAPRSAAATQAKTVDSIAVDLSAPDTVALGEPVRMRVTLTNATKSVLSLTIYGDKLYWLYFVRSSEGWIRYTEGNETPFEKGQLQLAPGESKSLVLHWRQNLTCCGGGQAGPGVYYIEALPLVTEPMDYRVTRRLVVRPSR